MSQKFKKIFSTLFIIILSLYLLLWWISPFIFSQVLTKYVLPQHIALNADSTIRYNPFTAHLSISELRLTDLSDDNKTVAEIKTLALEARLYQLFFDDIYISEFDVDGLFLALEYKEDGFYVSGMNTSDIATEDQTSDETVNEDAQTFSYRLILPQLKLQNSLITLLLDGYSHNIKFNDLNVNDLALALHDQNFNLNIESEVNDAIAKLALKGRYKGSKGSFILDLDFKNINVLPYARHLPEAYHNLSGEFSYQAKHIIEIENENYDVTIPNIKYNIDQLTLKQSDLKSTLNSIELEGKKVNVKYSEKGELAFKGDFSSEISGLKVLDDTNQDVLTSLDKANINGINISTSKALINTTISDVALKEFVFSKVNNKDIPALLSLSLMEIKSIEVNQESLVIDEVSVSGLQGQSHLGTNKKLNNLIAHLQSDNKEAKKTPSEATKSTTKTSEATAETPPTFAIKLNRIHLTDKAVFDLRDQSITPEYKRIISLLHFNTGPFDNTKPDLASPFVVKGSSDSYGKLDLTGYSKPFKPKPEYKFKGTINEIALPGISGYIRPSLGYDITSGELDIKLDGELIGTHLEGDVDLFIKRIQLEESTDHEGKAHKNVDKSVIPYSSALNMLKDSDDNIKLNLPLSGDTTNPNFGLSGFMKILLTKTMTLAGKNFALSTVLPYASVVSFAVSAAGEYALKVNIHPLEYQPTQTDVPKNQETFLKEFTKLLRDKPDVSIKACALVVPEDIGKNREAKLTEDDKETLIELAKARVKNFKDYVISHNGIKSSRIIFCKPKISTKPKAKTQLVFDL